MFHRLGKQGAAHIVAARQTESFHELADFCRRVDLPQAICENLILVGAFDSLNPARRDLLWELGQVQQDNNPLGLTFRTAQVDLPQFSKAELLYSEYRLLGLSPNAHIVALYRPLLTERGILSSQDLLRQPDSSIVNVAGQVVMHQAPPTAKGHYFLTLEDEFGMMNVIVRPDVYAQYNQVIHESPILVVEGQVQRQGNVINLVAHQAQCMTT